MLSRSPLLRHYTSLPFMITVYCIQGSYKGNPVSFDHCVMLQQQPPFWQSHMKGGILYLRFVSMWTAHITTATYSLHYDMNMCMIYKFKQKNLARNFLLSQKKKATTTTTTKAKTKTSKQTKKSQVRRYNNSPPSVMAKWPRGGTQIWVGQGCAARASKPLPIFKGDFCRKGYPFLRIFLEN